MSLLQGANRVRIAEFRKVQQHMIQQTGHIAHLAAYAYNLEREIEETSSKAIQLREKVQPKFDQLKQLEQMKQNESGGVIRDQWLDHQKKTQEQTDALRPKVEAMEARRAAQLKTLLGAADLQIVDA